MANPRYSKAAPSRGADRKAGKPVHGNVDISVPMKAADWPGVTGVQKNRSLGIRKMKQGPVEKGL